MVSTTEFYLSLQKIYVQKAEKDREHLKKLLLNIVAERGIQGFTFDEANFVLYCKNIKQLKVVNMRSVAEELDTPEWSKDLACEYWDTSNCCRWLVVMSAFETLWQQGHFLGENFAQ